MCSQKKETEGLELGENEEKKEGMDGTYCGQAKAAYIEQGGEQRSL